MSQMIPSTVTCPGCAATWSAPLFTAVDADTIPVQVEAILDGSFERTTCAACARSFRPEHSLLFVSHARRLWIVMQPLAQRLAFADIERGVDHAIATNIAGAAPVVAERLRGVRPRLVFGQHMLSEAVRTAYTGLETTLLECAKLLTVRRNLGALMQHGPFELCFERMDGVVPICAVHTVPAGERVGEIALASDVLAEVDARLPVLHERFPALFERPYASATRYLLAETV